MGPRLGTMRQITQSPEVPNIRPAGELLPLFKGRNKVEDPDYLRWVKCIVSRNRQQTFALNNPPDATLKIGDLEDPYYNDEELEWEKLYLPKPVKMEVVGVVEGTLWPCDQLVLMTCEKRKVYAFDGKKLHMVAESLVEICEKGLMYPSESCKRQPSKDMLQGACGEDEDPRPEPRLADQLSALFQESTEEKGFVSKNKKTFTLKNPAGARLKIGSLEDTIYKGNVGKLNGWGKFYLPKIVNMKVVGVVEGTSCPCDQLVLMTCEDRKLYAFDGEEEELHMVAESLEELGEKGLMYPSSQRYYKGEAFKDMTKEDWDKVRNGPVGKKLEADHLKLVEENMFELLKNL